MIKKFIIFCIVFLSTCAVNIVTAQLPYSTVQYAVNSYTGIDFDTQPNYCGRAQTLRLNIYKPVGDLNPDRPVIIFIHGGAFTSISNENDADMVAMARQFASRGYVAASIHYREGIHLFNYPQGNPSLTGTGLTASILGLFSRSDVDRLFASDSSEVIRAGYRAQQDLKSAIRFMKARCATDSSSTCKFFVAGHSAGAITVLGAVFLDNISEKPADAGPIVTVTNPSWTSNFLQLYGPGGQDNAMYRNQNPIPFDYNAASCYLRPDLGSIDGVGNDNGQSLQVLGIGSMAGAVQDTNMLIGVNKPAIYMYQMPNDVVVPYNSGKPFGIAATFIAPAPNQRWPSVYGTNFIKNKLQSIAYPTAFKVDTYDNGGDDLSSHSILPSTGVVSDSMARFFARVMDTSTRCLPIVLPVSIQFTAAKENDLAALSWNIYNTGDLSYTVLERSYDGLSFQGIHTSTSVSTGWHYYRDAPAATLAYYRLKQVDAGGRFTYSSTILLKFEVTVKSNIYPNPVQDMAILSTAQHNGEKYVQVQIIGIAGNIVKQIRQVNAGSSFTINMRDLPAGNYFIKIIHSGSVELLQVIVAR